MPEVRIAAGPQSLPCLIATVRDLVAGYGPASVRADARRAWRDRARRGAAADARPRIVQFSGQHLKQAGAAS